MSAALAHHNFAPMEEPHTELGALELIPGSSSTLTALGSIGISSQESYPPLFRQVAEELELGDDVLKTVVAHVEPEPAPIVDTSTEEVAYEAEPDRPWPSVEHDDPEPEGNNGAVDDSSSDKSYPIAVDPGMYGRPVTSTADLFSEFPAANTISPRILNEAQTRRERLTGLLFARMAATQKIREGLAPQYELEPTLPGDLAVTSAPDQDSMQRSEHAVIPLRAPDTEQFPTSEIPRVESKEDAPTKPELGEPTNRLAVPLREGWAIGRTVLGILKHVKDGITAWVAPERRHEQEANNPAQTD